MTNEAAQPDSQPVPGQIAIGEDVAVVVEGRLATPEDGPRVIAVDQPEPRIVSVSDTPDDPAVDDEDNEDTDGDDPDTDHEPEGVPEGDGDDGKPGEDAPAEVTP